MTWTAAGLQMVNATSGALNLNFAQNINTIIMAHKGNQIISGGLVTANGASNLATSQDDIDMTSGSAIINGTERTVGAQSISLDAIWTLLGATENVYVLIYLTDAATPVLTAVGGTAGTGTIYPPEVPEDVTTIALIYLQQTDSTLNASSIRDYRLFTPSFIYADAGKIDGAFEVTGITTLGGNLGVTGNISVSGTVDGVDIAANKTLYDAHVADGTIHYTQANIVAVGIVVSGTWQGGAIANAYIASDITLDNLTQITTKSHTVLTDIGSNSHGTIDTHLANTAKHVDWSLTGAGTIHANNYVDNDTTYVSSDFTHGGLTGTHNLTTDIDHNALTNYTANRHIDWTNATDLFVTTLGAEVGALKMSNPTSGGGIELLYDSATDRVNVGVSSERYKQDINDYDIDTQFIYDLEPKIYRYKPIYDDNGEIIDQNDKIMLGYIAEDVFELSKKYNIPYDFVVFNKDGQVEGINNRPFTPHIIASLKELNNKIILLESKISELSN